MIRCFCFISLHFICYSQNGSWKKVLLFPIHSLLSQEFPRNFFWTQKRGIFVCQVNAALLMGHVNLQISYHYVNSADIMSGFRKTCKRNVLDLILHWIITLFHNIPFKILLSFTLMSKQLWNNSDNPVKMVKAKTFYSN